MTVSAIKAWQKARVIYASLTASSLPGLDRVLAKCLELLQDSLRAGHFGRVLEGRARPKRLKLAVLSGYLG